MRERAVRTRRAPPPWELAGALWAPARQKPLGAQRRSGHIASFGPRVTKHESRPFYRVLRLSGGEKCRLTPFLPSEAYSRHPLRTAELFHEPLHVTPRSGLQSRRRRAILALVHLDEGE